MTSASEPAGCSFLANPPQHIFTPECFSADEKLMVEVAEQFSRNEVTSRTDAIERQEEGLMPKLMRLAGELGLCGVDVSETYGGLGLGKNLAARILEFMSLDGSFSVTYGVSTGIGTSGLSLFGNEDQKQRYLPRLGSGEWIGAYALSEPNSGTDALSATTRADRRSGGFVLKGAKMWISNAKWAELFLVMAKVDGDKFSAFLVERAFPGVKIEREEHKLGIKGSSTARVLLEDVFVPEANLLHEIGQGHKVALNCLNMGRFKLSSMSLGPARSAMESASKYALERRQFGRPIAEFGLIQKKFALMAALYFAAESMIYRTGALIDAGFEARGGSVGGNQKAAEEYAVECSLCKVFSTEAEAWIVDEALQVFGGYGYTEEFPAARNFRDARVSRIYEGTNEINRLFISDRFRRLAPRGALAESFVSELATKALGTPTEGQIRTAALSDLLIYAYCEQSARLRAKQIGQTSEQIMKCLAPWLNAKAAEAYQTATGEAVSLPEIELPDWEGLAARVYATGGPVQ